MPVDALDVVAPGELRLNHTFRRSIFTGEAVGVLLHHESPPDLVELCAAYWRDQFHVVFVDDDVRDALEAIRRDDLPEQVDAVLELIDAGLVVWLPQPQLDAEH